MPCRSFCAQLVGQFSNAVAVLTGVTERAACLNAGTAFAKLRGCRRSRPPEHGNARYLRGKRAVQPWSQDGYAGRATAGAPCTSRLFTAAKHRVLFREQRITTPLRW